MKRHPSRRQEEESVAERCLTFYPFSEVISVRRLLLFLILLLLVKLAAGALPLCEYRSPLTDLSDLGISFSYNYHNDPYGLSDQDRNFGQLNVDYTRLYDSPDIGFNISAQNEMTISVLRLSSYLITGEGNLKRYLAPGASFFGFAGVNVKSDSSYEAIRLAIVLGIGYGRFADVTPLAKAMNIDDYLVKHESITKHLDGLDLEAIAFEIDSIDTYDSLADLLAVLEEIIEGTGLAKAGGLDALDIYEMGRIIADDDHLRYCGGDIKLGLGYELVDPFGGPNDLLATAAFNYAFTITPQAQFLAQGTFSGSSEIFQTHQIEVSLGSDYVLTDTIDICVSYDFLRETWVGVSTDIHTISLEVKLTPIETAQVVLGMHFSHEPYFLEWSADISLLMSMDLL